LRAEEVVEVAAAEAGVADVVAVAVPRVPAVDSPLQVEGRVPPVLNRSLGRPRQVRLVRLLRARALGRAKAVVRKPPLALRAAPPVQKQQPDLVARRLKVPWLGSDRQLAKERRPSRPGTVQPLVS